MASTLSIVSASFKGVSPIKYFIITWEPESSGLWNAMIFWSLPPSSFQLVISPEYIFLTSSLVKLSIGLSSSTKNTNASFPIGIETIVLL